MPPFIITDFGKSVDATQNGVVVMTIPRYGYWVTVRGRSQCVDTSDNLALLQEEYGPDLPVIKLPVK